MNELKRSIAVAQKNMPNKRALDNELVTLQIQVNFPVWNFYILFCHLLHTQFAVIASSYKSSSSLRIYYDCYFSMKKLIVDFRLQLVASRERLTMLEKKLEDPSDENRVRLLGGDDPEPEVLAKKIEELELRLAEKEEKLLEKDLIFEEVTRLADRTKKKSETGKEDTLELAKKVGYYQKISTDLYSLAFPLRSFQFAQYEAVWACRKLVVSIY